jgi:hypothetical protein
MAVVALCLAPPAPAQLATLAGQQAAAGAGELKPLAIVAAEQYDGLVKDISFLGQVMGKPELGQMVEGGFAFFTQGKGPDAIDKTKPWGVIVMTDGMQILPVGCLPVTRLSDLLDVARAYQVEVKDLGNGVTELAHPERPIYVTENAGWAFIGQSPDSLAKLPPNPQGILTSLVQNYDLGASFSVKDIPEMYRQLILSAIQGGMQQAMVKNPEETDEQFAQRQDLAQSQLEETKRVFEELDTVQIGWNVDADQQKTYLDVVVKAVPGTRMAKEMAAYGGAKTNFAGFYQPDAAATMIFVSQADPDLVQQDAAKMDAAIATAREQFMKAFDENEDIPAELRDDLRAVANDWFDAFAATMKTGQMDGAAALRLAPDSMTLVAATLVKDTEKFESGLKKLEASAREKSDDFSGIQWNAAQHAGVDFHTLAVPVKAEQAAPRKLFGDELQIAIGIGREAIYLAVGRDHLEAVKKAIDDSAASPGKSVPPFELIVSAAPIAEVLADQAQEGPQKQIAQSVATMLRAEAQGEDRLRLVSQAISNGLRSRIEVEQGVLKAIGKASAEQQRQAQQANQLQ